MRLPKLPSRKEAQDLDAQNPSEPVPPTPSTVPSHSSFLPDLPPPPLTSDLVRSIRFTVSEPQGYYFEQVETFVEQAHAALSYYEEMEFRYRQAVYEMQIEMDQQAYDLQRTRSEIELFKVQGSPLVNADGSYVTESQQASIEALTAERDAARAEVARLVEVSAMQDQEISSLRQWGDEVMVEVHAMRDHIDALTSENDQLRASLASTTVAATESNAPSSPVGIPDDVPQVLVPQVPLIETAGADEESEHEDDYDEDEHDGSVGLGDDLAAVPVVDVDAAPVSTTAVSVEADSVVQPEHLSVVEAPSQAAEGVSQPDVPLHDPGAAGHQSPVPDESATGFVVGNEAAPTLDASESVPGSVPDVAVEALSDATEPLVRLEGSAADHVLGPPLTADAEEAPIDSDTHTEVRTDIEANHGYDPETEPEHPEHVDHAEPEHPEYPEHAERVDDLDAEEADGVAVAPVLPVDSELPEGVSLPGTGEAAITYPPAAPGIPLDTRGVPVEVWAPELDPRLRNSAD